MLRRMLAPNGTVFHEQKVPDLTSQGLFMLRHGFTTGTVGFHVGDVSLCGAGQAVTVDASYAKLASTVLN